MDTSLAVDTLEADIGIEEDRCDGAAQMLGIWGVCGFIGSALGPMIGGILLITIGKRKQETDELVNDDDNYPFYSLEGYSAVFSVAAFYFFASAISLIFVKKKGV